MWFTLYYSPNRYNTSQPLQMKGRFYGNFGTAAMALGLLRRHGPTPVRHPGCAVRGYAAPGSAPQAHRQSLLVAIRFVQVDDNAW